MTSGSPLVQQALLQDLACSGELRLPSDLRRACGEAVTQLLQRIEGHVGTFVASACDAGYRMVAMLWKLVLQLPHHVGLGCDQQVGRLSKAENVLNHRLGAADKVAMLADIGRAFGMSEGERVGEPAFQLNQVADAENLVDHAGAVP